jgi:hypothetical protein
MNAPQMNDPVDTDRYEIRLEGQLDHKWSEWFEGFTLSNETDGTTTLTGHVIDQAALHGLLRRVSDLGATLISVNTIDTTRPVPPTDPAL